MLSQGIYWSRIKKEEDGWFYKTREEWREETGMKRYEQEQARKLLVETGFWAEQLMGVPAQLYYRVDFEKLLESLILSWQRVDQPVGRGSANKKAEGLPALSSKTTTKTLPKTVLTDLDDSSEEETATPPPKEEENPVVSYRAAKNIFRTRCHKNLGTLNESYGEMWAGAISQYGEKRVLRAVDLWAKELGANAKKFDYPIALFLKRVEEHVEAFDIESTPQESAETEEEQDDSGTREYLDMIKAEKAKLKLRKKNA
jgi:hypothetical protein